MRYKYDNVATPWMNSYGEVAPNLDYSEKTISGAVLERAAMEGDFPALTFMGKATSYSRLAEEIDRVARSFYALGVRPGTRVLVCLPNVPQAVFCLYGLNRIGAIPTMVHPLSAVSELAFYMNEASCSMAVTLDQFYGKFLEVKAQRPVEKVVVCRVSDELAFPLNVGQKLMTERKFPKIQAPDIVWNDFLKLGESVTDGYVADKDFRTEAVVLFSGGTTGTTKGIMLSDLNFNALAWQTANMANEEVHHSKMLAAMPVFHGFGLGVCIHTLMFIGGTSILVPRFNVKSYAKLIRKTQPNFIAGVPTLFEAITRNRYLDGADLSCLRGVFSGGDSLTIELKKKFDKFLADHNASVRVREGYGTTECVTACCLTPYNKEKEGSIGIPFPDTYFKICKPGSCDEIPFGEEGEICLTGPSMMLGYIGHEEENKETLRLHEDGHVWLHTGDLGRMDDEGFIYFSQRMKRMIVTSGYNVYPSQLENIIEGHPAVQRSCVIGVKDPLKMQRVKAYVVLKENCPADEDMRKSIMQHCKRHIAKYALPTEIEFRESLPTTLVGKVAYTVLEKEEAEKEGRQG
ncbi:MAG: AMP-binding protein [Bacteroidales bacterium]|nr:AMP-binding protein [Bacteroidales bacterium]